jgi:hypothetical protein
MDGFSEEGKWQELVTNILALTQLAALPQSPESQIGAWT